MRKIVINSCYGGFSLSPEATLKLYSLGVKEIATPIEEYYDLTEDDKSPSSYSYSIYKWREYLKSDTKKSRAFLTVFSPDEKYVLYARNINRENPMLIKVIEEMNEKVNGPCAELKIVEIPDDVEFEIDEYDGMEIVREVHRTWS